MADIDHSEFPNPPGLTDAVLSLVPDDVKVPVFGCLSLGFELPEAKAVEGQTLLLIVAGTPWNQVKTALKLLLRSAHQSPRLDVQVIIYNQQALQLQLTKDNYEAVVDGTKAMEKTCFAAAFNAVRQVLTGIGNKYSEVVIGFMTDGEHTTTESWEQAQAALVSTLPDLPCKGITFHAVGFSRDHNFAFLNDIRRLGTKEGTYSYAEPSDGPEGLTNKLRQLFDVAAVAEAEAELTITLPDAVPLGLVDAYDSVVPPKRTLVIPVAALVGDEGKVEIWVKKLEAVVHLPEEMEVKWALQAPGGGKFSGSHLVRVRAGQSPQQRQMWTLRLVGQQVDSLGKEIVARASQKSGGSNDQEIDPEDVIQVDEWSTTLRTIKAQLESVDPFKLSRENRAKLLEVRDDIMQKITSYDHILAEWIRGTLNNAALARAQDIRYATVFAKARRQRVLDDRVQRNAQKMRGVEKKLKGLGLIERQLRTVSESSKDFFHCTLTQIDWVDMMEEDTMDIMGIGLSIKRPEVAVDDATQVRIFDIGGTFMCKSAIEDAIKFKIGKDDALKAHGGFDMSAELGVVLRGTGREPINSWLPLYIHPEHWKRVALLLPPSLGYFCTLDPLGYAPQQLKVMFMFVGTMVARVTSESSDHQLRILFQTLRTCQAIVHDFKLEDSIRSEVINFVREPAGRTKDVVQNLLVLVGYALSLPAVDTGLSDGLTLQKFGMALLEECIRRNAEIQFGVSPDDELAVLGFLDGLVGGFPDKGEADEELHSAATVSEHLNLEADQISPSPKSPLSHLFDIDHPTNSEVVFDWRKTNTVCARRVGEFLHRWNSGGYPTPKALASCMTFLNVWTAIQSTWPGNFESLVQTIDGNGGLAPAPWLAVTKQLYTLHKGKSIFSIIEAPPFADAFLSCQALRSMIAHGIYFRNNKIARDAIGNNQYLNSASEPEAVLTMVFKDLTARRAAEVAKREHRLQVEFEEKRERAEQDEFSGLLQATRESLAVPHWMVNRNNFGILRAFIAAPWSPYNQQK